MQVQYLFLPNKIPVRALNFLQPACHNIVSLVSYIGERPRWPLQSPNKGREGKAKG